MAPPITTKTDFPNFTLNITGTNIDAGNNDYVLRYNPTYLRTGFSIVTGTLTAVDVTILAKNQGESADLTNDLFSVLTLASNTPYVADIKLPVEEIIVRVARTNATNSVDLTIFAPRG